MQGEIQSTAFKRTLWIDQSIGRYKSRWAISYSRRTQQSLYANISRSI